jgi:transposase
VEAEALRDRTRAREDAIRDCQDAQLRLKALLLRHASRDTGRAHWGPVHWRWLSEGVCPTPAPHLGLQADLRAVSEPHERRQRLEHARQEHVKAWRLSPVVEALQALRGVQGPVAVTLVAAMGELTRFESPRELMKLLGLIPSDSASAAPRRQGSMTQAGNTHARRVLVEGAWAYRDPAKVSRHVPRRLAPQPQVIQAISGKAQVRRCQRDHRRVSRGQQAHGVPVAIARELIGCMWAMAKEGPLSASDEDGS